MPVATRTVRVGIVVGLIGYAAVAVFYTVFDLLAARGTFYTVNLLGMAVFRGLRDPEVLSLPMPLDWTAIIWYNAMHLVIALIIGLIVAWLIRYAELHPPRALAVTFVIVAGFVVTIVAVGTLTAGMRPLLPWWSIVLSNTLAVLLGGVYLRRQRPGLLARLVPLSA
ncbi:MAG: hypothetical protein ABI311_07045 [Gemmatimonadaceae bacterium]